MSQLPLFPIENEILPHEVRAKMAYERGLAWNGNYVPDDVKGSYYELEFLLGFGKHLDNDSNFRKWYDALAVLKDSQQHYYEEPFINGLLSDDTSTVCPYRAPQFAECWHIGRSLR